MQEKIPIFKRYMAQRQNVVEFCGATIVNESGFYSLVLASRMPNVKKFKR